MLKILAVVIATTMISSCKSKSQQEAQDYRDRIEKTVQENSPSAAATSQNKSFVLPAGLEKIVGDWQLTRVVADDNENHVVDGEEEKDAVTGMPDLLILNADGSCFYTVARLEGRYEIVSSEKGRKLVMYDRLGDEINKGRYILSVTADELVINRLLGGSDFEIFRRL